MVFLKNTHGQLFPRSEVKGHFCSGRGRPRTNIAELPNGPGLAEEPLECRAWKGSGDFSLPSALRVLRGGGRFSSDQKKEHFPRSRAFLVGVLCPPFFLPHTFLPKQFSPHPADCRRKPWPSPPGSSNVPTRPGASWPQKSLTSIRMTWKRTMCSCSMSGTR